MPHHMRGKGEAIKWLRAHVNWSGDECLVWPFSRGAEGYGYLGFNGKTCRAHRFMCELAHGPLPSPKHQAAHSCGRGKDGCVNPRHLSWKTISGNMLDRRRHGTQAIGRAVKLSEDSVHAIRAFDATGVLKPITKLAAQYGVSETTIRNIRADRLWKAGKKWVLTADKIAEIKQLVKVQPIQEVADQYGLNYKTVWNIHVGRTHWRNR